FGGHESGRAAADEEGQRRQAISTISDISGNPAKTSFEEIMLIDTKYIMIQMKIPSFTG
ncbi:Hypothetical protein FKW44_002133, partial [Caligus rogercresseyi]